MTASAVYYYFEDHLETTKINVQAGQNSKGSADLLFRSAATVFGRLLVAPRLPLG